MSHWLGKEKQHKAWAAQRLTSKARFLVINGVLAWGLPMFLVMGVGPALFGFPYRVTMTPQPKCYRARAIKTVELDASVAADIACIKSGVYNDGGLDDGEAAVAGNSACWNTEWNVRAEVVDQRSGAQVAVNQGVAIRVWETDASNSCK